MTEVSDLVHAFLESGGLERRPGVAARLFQLVEYVGHGSQAEGVVDEVLGVERAQNGAVADQSGDVALGLLDDAAYHWVGLGVHAGGVDGIVAAADAQKAGALLERLGAEPRDVFEGPARAERAVGVAVRHDVVGQPLSDARHATQERRRGGVDVDTYRVDAVLDDRVERARQLGLGHVVLVLADTDRLGIDLDQLGQWIL